MNFMDRIFGRKKSPNQSKGKGTSEGKFDNWLSTSEFVMNAINGGAQIKIKISEIPEVCTALMGGLEKEGKLNQQQFEQRLHGTCPNCGVRLKGTGIMMVAMMKKFDRPVFGAGSASTERVSNGDCANEKCKSKDIIIEWDALNASDLPFSL